MRNLLPIPALSLLILAACASPPSGATWQTITQAQPLLSRVDPNVHERLDFQKSGSIVATIGERDGVLAGPLLQWTIVDDQLVITDGDKPYATLTLIDSVNSKVLARDQHGNVVKYRIVKK